MSGCSVRWRDYDRHRVLCEGEFGMRMNFYLGVCLPLRNEILGSNPALRILERSESSMVSGVVIPRMPEM